MPLVYAAVMPHGGALVPGVDDGTPHESVALTKAMRDAARSFADAQIDSIVMANPHGIGFEQAHALTMSGRMAGELGPHHLEVPVDTKLADAILEAATDETLPCVGVIGSDADDVLPMDWGAFVPFWFIAEATQVPPAVVITPTRSRGFDSLATLGEIVAELAEASDKRVAIIASADNSHTHDQEGPYGFHPSGEVFDKLIVELTEEGEFEDYIHLDKQLLDEALPDSPWQLAILTGAFREVPFEPVKVTYDCPSYYGMMVAEFAPSDD